MRADDGRVVLNVVVQALTGREITVYGDGSQTRSFCYVDDLIAGLLRLAAPDGWPPGPVNLGNPQEMQGAELVESVLALTGSRSAVVRHPLPVDDPQRRRPDIALAHRELGWAPRIGLEAGLRATIAWFAAALGPAAIPPVAANDDAWPRAALVAGARTGRGSSSTRRRAGPLGRRRGRRAGQGRQPPPPAPADRA